MSAKRQIKRSIPLAYLLVLIALAPELALAQASLTAGASTQVVQYNAVTTYSIGGQLGPQAPDGLDYDTDPSNPGATYPLTASAIAISDDQTTVVLVTLDVVAMKAAYSENWDTTGSDLTTPVPGPGMASIAQQISASTGVPVSNILINATHTHHAPSAVAMHGYGRDPQYVTAVITAAATAAQYAISHQVPATLYYGHAENFSIGANSRLITSDGFIQYTQAPPSPDQPIDSSGPFDGDMIVLSLRDSSGDPIATFFTHNVHNFLNLSEDPAAVGPDIYGIAAQQLTGSLGVTQYYSGAAGSNHGGPLKTTAGGTATPGTSPNTLIDGGAKKWTTNMWTLATLTDSTRGGSCEIASNTSTSLTCAPGQAISGMTSGDSYQISQDTEYLAVDSIESSVRAAYQTAVQIGNPAISVTTQPFTYYFRDFTQSIESDPQQGILPNFLNYFEYPPSRAGSTCSGATWLPCFVEAETDLLPVVGESRTTSLQVIKIGDVYIAALPGEVFGRTGVNIKTLSPSPHTIVLGLSNDYIGYLPDRLSFSYTDPSNPNLTTLTNSNGTFTYGFAKGGYQTWVGLHSFTAVGTAEAMQQSVLSMIAGLGATASPPDGLTDYVVPWQDNTWGHRHLAVFRSRGDGTFDQYVDTDSDYSAEYVQSHGQFPFTPPNIPSPPTGEFAYGKQPGEWIPDSLQHDLGAMADVTGDGRADYVVVQPDQAGHRVFATYIAQPNGRFSQPVITVDTQGMFLPDQNGRDKGFFADVNGDGRADYVVVYPDANGRRNFAVFLGQADGTFAQYINTVDQQGQWDPDAQGYDKGWFADVNGDGRADYIVVWEGANGQRNLAVFLGQSDGTFAQYVNTVDQQGRYVADSIGRDLGQFADVNGDGRADYIVVYPGADNARAFAVFLGKSDGTFSQFVSTVDPDSRFVPDALGRDSGYFADVTGDGSVDYVVVYAGAGGNRAFATYISGGNGSFETPYVLTTTSDAFQLDSNTGRDMGRFGKINTDPYADYVVAYPDASNNRHILSYPGNANGTFGAGIDTLDDAGRWFPSVLGLSGVAEYGFFSDVH